MGKIYDIGSTFADFYCSLCSLLKFQPCFFVKYLSIKTQSFFLSFFSLASRKKTIVSLLQISPQSTSHIEVKNHQFLLLRLDKIMELETNYKEDSFLLVVRNAGSVWLEGWKSGRIKNGGRMEKWEDRKDFIFSHFCLVGSGKVEG